MGTMTMKYLIMFLISLGLLAALTIYAGADCICLSVRPTPLSSTGVK
jgi:hypothetical protein